VNVVSLGFRTDLMLRALEGSEIVSRGDYLVIRSGRNPGYWWGNFLLLGSPPRPDETGRWLSRFGAEFPEAGHVALGVDVTDMAAVDPAGLLAAGLRLERSTVLTAAAVHEPPHPDQTAQIRQLAGDDDWRQAAELRMAANQENPGGEPAFVQTRIAAERALAQAGPGHWFGAFRDGRLLASLGLVCDGSPVARYQNVETHPAARRQGLAGSLVCQAGRYGLDVLGAATLVIVADPDDVAIRVYRSVGFADTETQVSFELPPQDG
jgi:ribosomal protein S18 acetylase RimI-like enzyme